MLTFFKKSIENVYEKLHIDFIYLKETDLFNFIFIGDLFTLQGGVTESGRESFYLLVPP